MKKNSSKGLGDSIEKALKATGIDKVAKKILGDDCGCEERKKKLNQMFPYARPFTEDELSIYESVLPRIKGGRINGQDQDIMVKLYNKVFNANKKASSCGSCVKQTLAKLEKVYKNSCKINDNGTDI
jgi:hypothetical protein|tara:strand:- start:973 stop:1353 length:381 start_codon:yes stop_codon:yes gene_type:complete